MSLSGEAAVIGRVTAVFRARPARHIGLAVSGGSDSLAMLVLLAPWARDVGVPLSVATVDHGLRAEAAAEAAFVGQVCARLGVPHALLRWQGWDGAGNLQAEARAARQALLSGWAAEAGVDAVALGHTMDDQAETVLLRLARGSGVDGLSGMAAERQQGGLRWVRPLLGERREDLRDLLRARGQTWVEDPSNADLRFDRVRARQALGLLAPLGVDVAGLVATAERMAVAREALCSLAAEARARLARVEGGDVIIARPGFDRLPRETRARLLSDAIRWVGNAVYRPRLAALEAVLEGLGGGRRSLQGTLVSATAEEIRVGREWAAVAGLQGEVGAIWDGRWLVAGPGAAGLEVGALGEGLADCPGWRATGLPRQTLLASPAVWRGQTLVAAPVAGLANGYTARIVADFGGWPVSH